MKKSKEQIEKEVKTRAAKKKARADAFFIIYYDMGPERSLEILQNHVAELGLRRALNTFKRYSVQYDWQNRVIELDTRRQEREQTDKEHVRSQMVERHSRIGKTFQSLAMAGAYTFQQALERGEQLNFSASEMATLAKTGTDLELRAAGEPTLRMEVTTVLYNVLIARIARIFQEVNRLPNPEARENRFALMVDQAQTNAIEEVNALLEGK